MLNKNTLSIPESEGGKQRFQKSGSLLDILVVFAPLLIIGIIGEWLGSGTTPGAVLITLAYAVSVVIATAVLKAHGSSWREIGLARPHSWRRTILLAVGTFLAFAVLWLILQVIMLNLPGLAIPPSDQSEYNPLQGNLPRLLIMLLATWTTVAFGEEMLFRAFLTNALAGIFRNQKAQWVLALLGSSVIFGLAHFAWGLAGIVETTLLGLLLGFVYLRSGQNLWITIIAHALLNTLKFVIVFSGVA